jgi:hypothetical protein
MIGINVVCWSDLVVVSQPFAVAEMEIAEKSNGTMVTTSVVLCVTGGVPEVEAANLSELDLVSTKNGSEAVGTRVIHALKSVDTKGGSELALCAEMCT